MGRAESPWKHISLGGKGGNYVRAHDKDGQRADRMKPQSDSTRPRRLAIKKLDLVPYPLRLAVAELLEFSRDSVSSRLCPGCGLPSLGWTGDWQTGHGNRVEMSGGALTSIRRAPPLASRKVGLAMEIHVPSSISRRVSAFDGSWCFSGLVIVGFVSPGLRAQAGCQEGVTSKAWNAGGAMRLSSAARYKPDLSSRGNISLVGGKKRPRYGQGDKTTWIDDSLRPSQR